MMPLDIGALRAAYAAGRETPTSVVRQIRARIDEQGERPVWIATASLAVLLDHAARLEALPAEEAARLPLYGIPFAAKDNIDVAGFATTAGCPEFAYRPEASATVVRRLEAAGAICIGKTNLDQFATGLVGVRSPYGACASVYDARYIAGGSSSGSAVAVAKRLAAFSLGTDTAGSGRVPAAFNNLVGYKPTRGALSMSGVVPACRSLDCVSIFAQNAEDAAIAGRVAQGWDASDWGSRVPARGAGAAPWLAGASFRFGIPPAAQREFFGDDAAADLFEAAIARLRTLGGEAVEIDYAPFLAAAQLLYQGPWVAERLAALEPFMKDRAGAVHPVVRQIISGAARYSAVDTYRAMYRLEELKRAAAAEWTRMDVLVLPTTGATYTIEAVEADPVQLNTNLGYYTNFVNLMDLAAVAVPAGFRSTGLPFGISLIGPACSDEALLSLADRFHRGARATATPGCVPVAVLGAHLAGQPLNHQLTSRGARLVKTCRTAAHYRFYALRSTQPPKPGLVMEPGFSGPGIEVEIWAVPEDAFGSFVAEVPPPLAIGNAQLDTGEWVKCFVCEPHAVAGSTEITGLGGWRAYLATRK
ncbi:MAG: allophanate hydrolase [Bryobacterales bacterium]|nr:allophanate hydrolase [Bryobacterales bacterium]